ncbi:MAG: TlpA family protein disulfide reductase [Ichthyobacteriaceae bacterium]|nr:TlpA family protein disulfide reductase [Ichthyobacteriaceae bacterium]
MKNSFLIKWGMVLFAVLSFATVYSLNLTGTKSNTTSPTPLKTSAPFISSASKTNNFIEYNIIDIEGNKWDNIDLSGSVVVFNFWFSACPPCKKEIPELNKLVDHYADKNVIFIAVSLNNHYEVENYIEKNPFKYHLVANGDAVIDGLGINAFPTQIIIDKDGSLFQKIQGKVTYLEMKNYIDKVCSKQQE